MTCYHPINAFRTPNGVVFKELAREDIIGDIKLPCGRCLGCRLRRASDWELRIMHEAQQHDENCFVTLTYDNGNLPPNGSLSKRDHQLFLKRLRKQVKRQIRYYIAGEYGPKNGRPHYHACLFNLDFADKTPAGKSRAGEIFYESEQLTRIWGMGKCSVQPLTNETASYAARYIMSKAYDDQAELKYTHINPETGEIVKLQPEYNEMSRGGRGGQGGIARQWFEQYHRDIYPHGYAIQRGQKRNPPKFYDRLMEAKDPQLYQDRVKHEREKKALQHASENTPERLEVRERVHQAQTHNLLRDLEP